MIVDSFVLVATEGLLVFFAGSTDTRQDDFLDFGCVLLHPLLSSLQLRVEVAHLDLKHRLVVCQLCEHQVHLDCDFAVVLQLLLLFRFDWIAGIVQVATFSTTFFCNFRELQVQRQLHQNELST